MPRFCYNSNNSSPEDAVRNEVEINAIVAYLFANAEKHEFAVKNPPRGDAKRGEEIVKAIGCQGCHVVGEGIAPKRSARAGRSASRSRTSATRRPTSGSTTGSAIRSTTARRPTCRTCASPTRRWRTSRPISSTLKGRPATPRRRRPDQKASDDVLLDYLQGGDAVRGREGAAGEDGPARRSRSSSDSARSAATAASAATTSRASRRRSRSAPICPKRAASWSRVSTSRSSPTSRTRRSWRGSARKLHDPRIFDKGRVLQPLDKLRMPNFDFSDDGDRAAADGDHELPARDSAAGGDAGALGAERLSSATAERWSIAATASAATSSRATAATSSSSSPIRRSVRRC